MAKEEIILKTIKKMLSSGLSENTILSTLDDLGLSQEEKEKYMAMAKGEKQESSKKEKAKKETESEDKKGTDEAEENYEDEEPSGNLDEEIDYNEKMVEPEEVHDKIAERTASRVRKELEEKEAADQFRETTTNVMLDQLKSSLDELNENIEKMKVAPLKATGLDSRIKAIEDDLSEVKAGQKALQKLLQKILDANRDILMKME